MTDRVAEIQARADAATEGEWRELTIYPGRAEVLTSETHQKIAGGIPFEVVPDPLASAPAGGGTT